MFRLKNQFGPKRTDQSPLRALARSWLPPPYRCGIKLAWPLPIHAANSAWLSLFFSTSELAQRVRFTGSCMHSRFPWNFSLVLLSDACAPQSSGRMSRKLTDSHPRYRNSPTQNHRTAVFHGLHQVIPSIFIKTTLRLVSGSL